MEPRHHLLYQETIVTNKELIVEIQKYIKFPR